METISEPTFRAVTFKREVSPVVWENGLARLPYARALQSWPWGEFKSRWEWTAMPLTMRVAGNHWQPTAAALVLKRQLPRLPYSILYVPKGPAFDYQDRETRNLVLSELEKLSRRERAIFIKIDPEVVQSWGIDDRRVSPLGTQVIADLEHRGWRESAEQIQFRNTVEIYLDRSEEDLLAAMKSKTRYNIRLAGRRGVTVRDGSPADFPIILTMYQETAARDGFAIRPAAYYMDGWQTLYDAGMAHILIAEYEQEPVAAVILVRYGDRTTYMYGASSGRARKHMPNYLLQWEAIRWAKQAGCTVYDMWGAPDAFDESDRLWGVWRFKSGFNGEVAQFIGAWDYPTRPLLYQAYTGLMPRVLDVMRSRNKNTIPAPTGT